MSTEEIINKAQELAFDKHNNPGAAQRYGDQPYSIHIDDVVRRVKKYLHYIPIDKHYIVICAAYLHDIVEDTEITPNQLKHLFNEEIANIVYRVSNERGWDKREILFKTLPKIWKCDLSIYIKLCDRISNGANSKRGESKKAISMYKKYKNIYPTFRYALKIRNLYKDMWEELDEIFEYKKI